MGYDLIVVTPSGHSLDVIHLNVSDMARMIRTMTEAGAVVETEVNYRGEARGIPLWKFSVLEGQIVSRHEVRAALNRLPRDMAPNVDPVWDAWTSFLRHAIRRDGFRVT